MSTNDLFARPLEAIVIGGSAGAVRALQTLLAPLPAELALPIIIVVHLPASQPSLLVEVFSRICRAPSAEPEDKQPVAPGIWFAPRGYHLLVERTDPAGARFALSVDEPVKLSRPSIDTLFESAADAFGARLVGLVLTGASTDGADGAYAIARAGGLVLVQDPTTADTAIMPAAAIAATRPDLIAPLPELATMLSTLAVRRPS